jgi:nitrogen fixation protein NifQ
MTDDPKGADDSKNADSTRDGRQAWQGRLLQAAADPSNTETRIFAQLLAARIADNRLALLGLSQTRLDALIARHFAIAPDAAGVRAAVSVPLTEVDLQIGSPHRQFVDELHALLLDYEQSDPAASAEDARDLASMIATACLRPDHLWRDLGLTSRDDVSAILQRHYPRMVALNLEAMRWKKFLARQVALRHGREPGTAPGCPGCEDYAFCYPDRGASAR